MFSRFSQSCYEANDGEVTCRNCPEGYTGRRCERCAEGYVGNPLIPGSSCRKTQSKENDDPFITLIQFTKRSPTFPVKNVFI